MGQCLTPVALDFAPLLGAACPREYLRGAVAWYCGDPYTDKWVDKFLHKSNESECALRDFIASLQ